ncbi:hypothetical protein FAI40_01810 [Acetobacteraceae bacterium]|nr:hypothetical protein FAI40_01810 [Acetobacteraceae bacterium]
MNIRSCPFCKKEGEAIIIKTNVPNFFVRCENCAGCGPWNKREEMAIQAWNKGANLRQIELSEDEENDYLIFCLPPSNEDGRLLIKKLSFRLMQLSTSDGKYNDDESWHLINKADEFLERWPEGKEQGITK